MRKKEIRKQWLYEDSEIGKGVREMGNNKAVILLSEIMNTMEERGFEQWEAEWVARKLPIEIKENSKRKRAHQPFTVFRQD